MNSRRISHLEREYERVRRKKSLTTPGGGKIYISCSKRDLLTSSFPFHWGKVEERHVKNRKEDGRWKGDCQISQKSKSYLPLIQKKRETVSWPGGKKEY